MPKLDSPHTVPNGGVGFDDTEVAEEEDHILQTWDREAG